ncbi:hypothetical protein HAX54_002081, partial [Datura stramonium]|nr:hypothetical protein [Datura stramonium]
MGMKDRLRLEIRYAKTTSHREFHDIEQILCKGVQGTEQYLNREIYDADWES